MDLLSSTEKTDIMSEFVNLHDTFGRDIKIFKRQSGTTSVITDPNYNPLYGRIKDSKKEDPSLAEYTKKARIRYEHNQKSTNGSAADIQANVSWPLGTIRLKIDSETLALISDSKRIEVDGHLCELISQESEIGPFTPQYKTVYLKRV